MTPARILMVEDQMHLAMMLEEIMADAGYDVISAGKLERAMKLARDMPLDAAILDINLGDGITAYPLADLLERRGVPYAFASGYSECDIPQPYRSHLTVHKPYAPQDILAAIGSLLADAPGTTGRAAT
ncbi:response regulator receiver domain-containing protein [Luteimonas cucumeris]|uniref:Response regulator receiver domain-containing protein n=1 Tax=Luteimonas cucumeris TaxID=985012 RepID=A0A562L286_9GAMM|nr:response regulator [Luteimonas cucumeris]TWI01743.1 response regulator receiver domain-containing protein [Luteimonas cucumeris]